MEKRQKIKEKTNIFKATRVETDYLKSTVRLIADLLSAVRSARKQQSGIFKMCKWASETCLRNEGRMKAFSDIQNQRNRV